MNRFFWFCGIDLRRTFLVVCLCLAGCSPAAPGIVPTASAAVATIAAVTDSPTVTETAIPAATVAPSAVLSTDTPTAAPQVCQQAGAVSDFEIDSEPLGRSLPGKIYLPPCYDPGLPGGYPVLYLLHGQSYDQSMWLNLGAAQIADRLIQSGEIAPMIMVMPREEYYLQDPAESQFRSALIESLIPWVDASYNSCAQRTCRAIGGISRGAYWAIKLGLSDWQYFISAGAHSLPGGPYSYTKIKLYMNAMPPDALTRLSIDIGSGDGYHKTAQQYVDLLAKAGYPVDWRDPEGIHNPDYWKAHLEEYLRWYAKAWRIENGE